MKRRQTASKTAILDTLKSSKNALSHEMLQETLDDKYDRATIYRILNQFCEDGLVHKVQGDDGKQYFALCSGCKSQQHEHNHFHFRCTACGMVECLDDQIQLVLPKGYTAESFNGLISGHCQTCTLC
jgi:Fur family ferric uptake transcriptional regulator